MFPYGDERVRKPIVVEDHVWIGRNAIIGGGVTIHEGAVVGMGAVVTRDVPPLAVVGGNPARVIKFRDGARFRDNIRNGRFLLADGTGCSACRTEDFFLTGPKLP